MPTLLSDLRTQVRRQLRELTARFWSDAELDALMAGGYHDIWGAILDVHGDHYLKICEDGSVYLKAGDTRLTGVPSDCFRVQFIEPNDTTIDGRSHLVQFAPKKFNSTAFAMARAQQAQDPGTCRLVLYDVSGIGAPVNAPTILTAPKLTADVKIRLAYNPVIDVTDGYNPIPGESDTALKAWTIAYARAKDNASQAPDAGWLSIYATEKKNIITRLTPRQEQDPEVVEDLFTDH